MAVLAASYCGLSQKKILNKIHKIKSVNGRLENIVNLDNNSNIIRQYGIGAQILKALGIKNIKLLTNSGTPKLIGLEGYGLKILETNPIKKFS